MLGSGPIMPPAPYMLMGLFFYTLFYWAVYLYPPHAA
jgi:hypothetical protein